MSFRYRTSIEHLTENVMFDILSRLPVKTIIHCRSVCKKWTNLVQDSYFINLHLSRSPSGLIIHHTPEKDRATRCRNYDPGILKWVAIEDESGYSSLHHDPVMNFDLNLAPVLRESQILQVGSVNGLVCLWQFGRFRDDTFVCNPVTREYIIIPRQRYYREGYAIIVYGFGVCLRTKEYKVVRVFQGDIPPNPSSTSRPSLLEAEVYTLGSGRWRSLGRVPYWLHGYHGPFLNGRVHWLVRDQDCQEKICAFDFDDESFELVPSPCLEPGDYESQYRYQSLGVVKGCLAECDIYKTRFTVWVMKEYGVKESWRRELVIDQIVSPIQEWEMWDEMYLLEWLKDGTILMVFAEASTRLLAYSTRTGIVEDTWLFDSYITGLSYRPSFVRLVGFESEKVYMV